MISDRILGLTDEYELNLAYIQTDGTDYNPILPSVSELMRLNRPIKVPKVSLKESEECIPVYWG